METLLLLGLGAYFLLKRAGPDLAAQMAAQNSTGVLAPAIDPSLLTERPYLAPGPPDAAALLATGLGVPTVSASASALGPYAPE